MSHAYTILNFQILQSELNGTDFLEETTQKTRKKLHLHIRLIKELINFENSYHKIVDENEEAWDTFYKNKKISFVLHK